MSDDMNQSFEEQLQKELRASEELDDALTAKLHQARVNALHELPAQAKKKTSLYIPLIGTAVAATALVVVFMGFPINELDDQQALDEQQMQSSQWLATVVKDELIVPDEVQDIIGDEELYEELEFYMWLAEHQNEIQYES